MKSFCFFFCDFLLAVVVVVYLSSLIQAKEDDDIAVLLNAKCLTVQESAKKKQTKILEYYCAI